MSTSNSDRERSFGEADDDDHPSHPSYSFYKSMNLNYLREDTTRIPADESAILIAAVVQNDVDFLKNFSKSPEWYNVKHPRDGNSLLQIGIIHKQQEVCDYLLSVPNFPLDSQNNYRMTALGLALYETDSTWDHISCELIKKGASLNAVPLYEGDTLLHHCIDKFLVKVSKLLMEMGYDVNAVTDSRLSPLWCCLEKNFKDVKIEIELVTLLLYYGADPAIGTLLKYNTFEYAVKYCSFPVKEALFYYTFDRHTSVNIHFEVLLILAGERSPFFHETVKQTKDVILGRSSVRYHYLLFVIHVKYLDALIKKFGDVMAQVFTQVLGRGYYEKCNFRARISLRNLNLLLESDLRRDTINFIVILCSESYFYDLVCCGRKASVINNICYLLSYGLKLSEDYLEYFYRQYGYGELVKILLHMDLEKKPDSIHRIQGSFINFLYDVHMTLDKYLQNQRSFRRRTLCELSSYFVHPQLQERISRYKICGVKIVTPDQPKVPLLVELARNVFRTYFVQRLNIESAKQFYGLVNSLPIGYAYKKIITYETRLY